MKVRKQTSRNSRINLRHTLASNETKQPTSILSEQILLQQKLNILHHTTYKQAIGKNGHTETKNRNGKKKPDNLRKTVGSD